MGIVCLNRLNFFSQFIHLNTIFRTQCWQPVCGSFRHLLFLSFHAYQVCDRLTRVSVRRKETQLSTVDIWLQLIIEKDSCLFIDLSSVPYFWALFFNHNGVITRNTHSILYLGTKHCLNPSVCSCCNYPLLSNPPFVFENEAALGNRGLNLLVRGWAKPFGVKQDRDNKRGGDTMWEGSGSACLFSRLLFVFLSEKSV